MRVRYLIQEMSYFMILREAICNSESSPKQDLSSGFMSLEEFGL